MYAAAKTSVAQGQVATAVQRSRQLITSRSSGVRHITVTEFEGYRKQPTCKLPRPATGGYARSNFIQQFCTTANPVLASASSSSCMRQAELADIYELLPEVLGRGTFGQVNTARHRHSGDLVAVKTVRKEWNRLPPEFLAQEVDFLRAVDHPNVARHYETFEDQDNLHFVMERCVGGTMMERLALRNQAGQPPAVNEAELAAVMHQVLLSVAHCHAQSIVHRDLKPHNFLFKDDPEQVRGLLPGPGRTLKLIDFGVSGVIPSKRPEKRRLTKRSGTEGFMAPEVMQNQPYGYPADMFSVGAVMYTILVGEPPKWNKEGKCYSFASDDPRLSALSSDGYSLLQRLLATNPAERPSAKEAACDAWFASTGVAPVLEVSSFLVSLFNASRFSQLTKLERVARLCSVSVCALRYDDPFLEPARKNFLAANTSASGALTFEEFHNAVSRTISSPQAPRDLSGLLPESSGQLFDSINTSRTGRLSYSEWMAATTPSQWWLGSPHHVRRAFDVLDRDGKGYVTSASFSDLMPEVFNPADLFDEFFHVPHTGRLDLNGFSSLLEGSMERAQT